MIILSKAERAKKRLQKLPAFALEADAIDFLHSPQAFKARILKLIEQAKTRIYFTLLYWEQDEAGQAILQALYAAKAKNPALDVKIFVDWHRAQRGRIGEDCQGCNADWYQHMRAHFEVDDVQWRGVPINTREVFGVLHLKGFVFDDTVLYSGASINNVYLHQQDRYRYDRYHEIRNAALADSMVAFIDTYLDDQAVLRLDEQRPATKTLRPQIRQYRKALAKRAGYFVENLPHDATMTITPLFGLGKRNLLNKVIEDLFVVVEKKLVICTPYFNLPRSLQQRIRTLLQQGKQVEIIVGDKTANDFYIPPSQPFKLAGALPYLYEKNLRRFMQRFASFIENQQLTVRLWKDGENSYHLKGIWVDDRYILLTGNNLNPRAWRLDAENGLLIHDSTAQLAAQSAVELDKIRTHTTALSSYLQLEKATEYPQPVRKVLRRFERIKADHIVRMIL